jgi:hypothetical protein
VPVRSDGQSNRFRASIAAVALAILASASPWTAAADLGGASQELALAGPRGHCLESDPEKLMRIWTNEDIGIGIEVRRSFLEGDTTWKNSSAMAEPSSPLLQFSPK